MDDTAFAQVNVVGNYWKAGPTGLNFLPVNSVKAVRIYSNNNFWDAPAKQNATPMPGDADTIFQTAYGAGPTLVSTEWNFPAVTTHTAHEAYDTVLALAGVVPHDSLNRRTIENVKNGTGRMGEMDEPFIVKGPEPPADADMDGMPDYWETAKGLNPNDPGDATGDFDGIGYTNIEKYINDLALVLLGQAPIYPGTGIETIKAGQWRWSYVNIIITDSATGLPLSGVLVQVKDTTEVVTNSGTTDAQGTCLYSEDAGKYVLHLTRDQYTSVSPQSITLTEGETLGVAIAMVPYTASGIKFIPCSLTVGPGRSASLDVLKEYPDNSILPMTESLDWTVVPANMATVDNQSILTSTGSTGSAEVIAAWTARGFSDTCRLTIASSVVFVDFGSSLALHQYGVEGWDSTFKDIYVKYTADGPAGFYGSNNSYNFQGIRLRDSIYQYKFESGDTLKVSWYNNTGSPITCTPRISFERQGRIGSGADWHDMSEVTVPAQGTAASTFAFEFTTAKPYILINVNSNYSPAGSNAELICDKIELAFAAPGTGSETLPSWLEGLEGIVVLPNPFSSSTTIVVNNGTRKTEHGKRKRIDLKIYNINGKLVMSKSVNPRSSVTWNAAKEPTGIYLAVVKAGKKKLVKKLILMR